MPQGPLAVKVVNTSATGNSWFVNETTGSDTTGNGSAIAPYATLDTALAAATANNNDVVYLSGTSHRTTTLAWNKNGVSLVGLAAPSDNDRARIATTSVANGLTQTLFTALHPLISVTAQGCSFVNLGTFFGGDGALTPPTDAVCWDEVGGRNFYSNVQFLGGGDVLMAALVGMRSLRIGGSGENLFVGCTYGLDTVVRATNTNATLELISGTPRNIIRNGVFQANVSAAADSHITVGADGIDRYLLLDNCTFINASVGGPGATPMTAAIVGNASAGGVVLVQGGASVGSVIVGATAQCIYVSGAVPSGHTSSLAVTAS